MIVLVDKRLALGNLEILGEFMRVGLDFLGAFGADIENWAFLAVV